VTIPSLVTAFAGGLLVLGSQSYFVLTGLLLIAAATLMVFKRAADTVSSAGAASPRRFRWGGRGISFRPCRCRWWRVSDAAARCARLGFATARSRAFASRHPLQFRGWPGRRLPCWPSAGAGHAGFLGWGSTGRRHRHRHRSAMDVGAHYALRSRGHSSVRWPPPFIALGFAPLAELNRWTMPGKYRSTRAGVARGYQPANISAAMVMISRTDAASSASEVMSMRRDGGWCLRRLPSYSRPPPS
jgi:hypothetical protein